MLLRSHSLNGATRRHYSGVYETALLDGVYHVVRDYRTRLLTCHGYEGWTVPMRGTNGVAILGPLTGVESECAHGQRCRQCSDCWPTLA
jgi:hypothetical protein